MRYARAHARAALSILLGDLPPRRRDEIGVGGIEPPMGASGSTSPRSAMAAMSHVAFRFSLPLSPAAGLRAAALRDALVARGYRAGTRRDGDTWTVDAHPTRVRHYQPRRITDRTLGQIAHAHGATFDGFAERR
jgi:hypothetical protein